MFENQDRYEGPWINGVPHTNSETTGVYTFFAGGVYEGCFKEGKMIEGTQRDKEGNSYYGKWVNGMLNGPGWINLVTHERAEGNFVNNELSGKGIKVDILGNRWEGYWTDGKLNGPGTLLLYKTGGSYQGDFKNSLRHGMGEDRRGNEEFFNGEFENDILVRGICKQFMSDGSTYEGQIEGKTLHGKGIRTYPNIGVYEGMFENGLKSGQGRYTYSNIVKYSKFYANNPNFAEINQFFTTNNVFNGISQNDIPYSGNGTLVDENFGIIMERSKKAKELE